MFERGVKKKVPRCAFGLAFMLELGQGGCCARAAWLARGAC